MLMKRFLMTIALYTGILAFLTLGINAWYLAMDQSDDLWTDKFKDVPAHIQICNFGSSHGLYSFNYEDVCGEFTCFNFALASQSLSYDLRILQQYKDHLKEGCLVFIPVSYFSFFGIEETQEEEFLSKNRQYYDFLSPGQIKEYDFSTHMFKRFFPALDAYETLPTVLFFGKASGNEELWSKSALDMDVSADAALAFERHFIQEKLNPSGERIVNKEEVSALGQMILLCREIGAVPVLVTTPYLEEYLEEINANAPDFDEEFSAILSPILTETGTAYMDYSSDLHFTARKDLFMNADHLNKEGARQFTNLLLENYGNIQK